MPQPATTLLLNPETTSCGRCNGVAILRARSENFCKECFISYVQSKIIKRMDAFRVRNKKPEERRKILLALSLGVSSLSLLHVLDLHIERQLSRTGRSGLDLHILFLYSDSEGPTADDLEKVKKRYSRHIYSDLDFDAVSQTDEEDGDDPIPRSQKSIPSATSRSDVTDIRKINIISNHAIDHGCEAVLWGHSTTRLAEKVLAETAKGRGFALPWVVNGFGISFAYPLQDLLKREVEIFAEITDLPSTNLRSDSKTSGVKVSSRTATIDSLMRGYLETVETNYPSIVANVVRTSDKLIAAPSDTRKSCGCCKMPLLDEGIKNNESPGNEVESTIGGAAAESGLCYGCKRSIYGSRPL